MIKMMNFRKRAFITISQREAPQIIDRNTHKDISVISIVLEFFVLGSLNPLSNKNKDKISEYIYFFMLLIVL